MQANYNKYKLQSKAKLTQLKQNVSQLVSSTDPSVSKWLNNDEFIRIYFEIANAASLMLQLEAANEQIARYEVDIEQLQLQLTIKQSQIADYLIRIKVWLYLIILFWSISVNGTWTNVNCWQ